MAEVMGKLRRTHYCGTVRESHCGQEIVICGWVQKSRDLGNLIFLDVRDRTGIIQLAFDDHTDRETVAKASQCRSEFVVMAKGSVRERESKNTEISTGNIEVFVSDLRILSKAEVPPFAITDNTNVNEELRLRYRYLDLRRSEMQQALMLRHKIVKAARDYYDQQGFLEIETPVLIKSTPEGARDYLVPSRVHPGKFFALPQSPQLYKQLLMLSGYDRYMQIARCFRDEDLRADRQPEFTQIDLEMSFVDSDDVMCVNEGFMQTVMDTVLGVKISTPFKKISYKEAMERYGSDKPDTRYEMELVDVSACLQGTEFKVFAGALTKGSVRGINVKGGGEKFTRKEIDKLVEFVKTYQAKGLAYTRLTSEAETSSYEKFLSEEEKQAVRKVLDAEKGDLLLLVADQKDEVVFHALGALRCHIADRLKLVAPDTFDLLWVTDFPLLAYDEEAKRYGAVHHPFTAVKDEDMDKLEKEPEKCLAKAYDLVMNGCEVGGGSIRINDPQTQNRMFQALGFSEEEAKERFGFLMDAFRYGAPPHGGMAYGLDRLVMLMMGKSSIRDVIAFPKVQNASELMTACPAQVDTQQLDELGIQIKEL